MKYVRAMCLMLLCLLLGACSASSPNQQHPADDADDFIVVGFSQVGAESDWRNAHTQSMQEALSEQNGFRLILDDAQQKQERQITAIRNFIQQEVDVIVLAPTTETGWDTVLAEARSAGIPVIVVDRMIEVSDQSLYACWVGSDFLREGHAAIAWMEQHLGDGPVQILHLQGSIGSSAQLGRTQALDEALGQHPAWQLAARDCGEFTEAKGQELVENLLAQGTAFNVIYSENDNMTYGAINALKAHGLTPGKDVTILSFDASRTALALTLRGEISIDVECNPLHGPLVRTLIESLRQERTLVKQTFVEETSFDTATLTQEVIDGRAY